MLMIALAWITATPSIKAATCAPKTDWLMEKSPNPGIVFLLRGMGYDRLDESTLVPLIRIPLSPQEAGRFGFPRGAVRAAYMLRWVPKTDTVLTALREAARSEYVDLAAMAIESLAVLDDCSWIKIAKIQVVSRRKHDGPIMRVGADLASVGKYDGWPAVKDNILASTGPEDTRLESGTSVLKWYVGSANDAGKQFREELESIRWQLPSASRGVVDAEVRSIK